MNTPKDKLKAKPLSVIKRCLPANRGKACKVLDLCLVSEMSTIEEEENEAAKIVGFRSKGQLAPEADEEYGEAMEEFIGDV